MKSSHLVTAVGVVLIATAWILASGIPKAATNDFDLLVRSKGGRMSHTANFPDAYRQMSANRRMLQNAYLGGAGFICLAVGLMGIRSRENRREDVRVPDVA